MNSTLKVLLRELDRIKRHPRYVIILTLGAIFSYVFFLTLMKEGQPEKLPIAIVDSDGSYLSRRLCHEIEATQGVEVVAVYGSHNEARQAMQQQKIYAFLEIPKGTYSELLDFKTPHISLYANNAYLLAGQLSYKTLITISRLASGAVHREILRKKGVSEDKIMATIQPIVIDSHFISNPWANYQPYVLTTVLPGILGLMVALISIYVFSEEQRLRTIGDWMRTADGKLIPAMVGKLLPYTFLFTMLGIVGNIIFFGFENYVLLGSFWSLTLVYVLYIMAIQSMAIVICVLIGDMHMAICVGAIYTTLAFTMAGFSYPVTSMPPALQGFSLIFPLRHYYLTYVDIALYGAGAKQWLMHMLPLIGFIAAFFIAGLIFNRNFKRGKRYRMLHPEINEPQPPTTDTKCD
ncbi:MAG: ABC transporter permease [Bacteroidales bacterium]|nr:ABC transporter permease [Bacteroidales bacterium]